MTCLIPRSKKRVSPSRSDMSHDRSFEEAQLPPGGRTSHPSVEEEQLQEGVDMSHPSIEEARLPFKK